MDLQEVRPTDHDLRLIQTRRLDTLNFLKTDLVQVGPAVLAATVLAVERTDLRHYDPDVLFPMMAAAQSRLTRLPIVRMGNNTAAFSACLEALIAAGGGRMVLPVSRLGIYRGKIIIPPVGPATKPPTSWATVEIVGGAQVRKFSYGNLCTGACGYNRPCVHQYVGKSQSCML